jgi:thioredoxin reductase (NADPH)
VHWGVFRIAHTRTAATPHTTQNLSTGEASDLPVAGLFYGIGHRPNSDLFTKWIETDAKGYVVVSHGASTNVDGVFSAGDLHDPEWRQAVTAAGSGCMAALSAERYLTETGLATEFKTAQSPSDEAPAASDAASPSGSDDTFDVVVDKHRGQFALRKLYHASDRPIVVLYTSSSCGPCKSLKPILNKVIDEYPGRVHYVEINIEDDPEIAEAAGVAGTPTMQLFKDKARVKSVPGVKSKSDYRKMIEEAMGPVLQTA